MIRAFLILTLFLLFAPLGAWAGVEQISEQEFRALAIELSHKVPLFREVWKRDPKAEFYGGTSRDFLYWLKGQFREAHSKADAQSVAMKLRAMPVIDPRSFIVGESDIDIVSKTPFDLNADSYGVRKIDFQSDAVFDPETPAGFNDRHQGFIPAEKIRLAHGKIETNAAGIDGLSEIYRGKISVHFASAEEFALTSYAKAKENHPILLAARYLRLQAINYFKNHGGGFPDPQKLMDGVNPEDEKKVKAVIAAAIKDGSLKEYFAQTRFQSWLNGSIQKAFRSYTNPTAALELFKKFGMDDLVNYYANDLEPINQYVFAKYRDTAAIKARLKEYNVDEAKFFVPRATAFSDGKLYHGTKTEEGFRSILLQGILPSSGGNAGEGLYGVPDSDRKFSEEWAGSPDRLIEFPVKKDARIVDLTSGEAKRVLSKFRSVNGETFDEAFGIDIEKYDYGKTNAYVVKNSAALDKPQGVYRKVLTLPEVIEVLKKSSDPVKDFVVGATVSRFTSAEIPLIVHAIRPAPEALVKILTDPVTRGLSNEDLLSVFTDGNLSDWRLLKVLTERRQKFNLRLGTEDGPKLAHLIHGQPPITAAEFTSYLRDNPQHTSTELLQPMLKEIASSSGWEKHPELMDILTSMPESKPLDFYLNQALDQPQWKHSPSRNAWLGKLATFERNKKPLVDWLTSPAASSIPKEELLSLFAHAKFNAMEYLTVLDQRGAQFNERYYQEEKNLIGTFIDPTPIPVPEIENYIRKVQAASGPYKVNGMRDFVEHTLTHPGWEKHPEIVDAIVNLPETQNDLRQLIYIFNKPEWLNSPHMMGWLEKMSDSPGLRLIYEEIFRYLPQLPESSRKAALVKKFVAMKIPEVDELLLKNVFNKGVTTRDDLEAILNRTEKGNESTLVAFAEGPLQLEPWNKEYGWAERIIKESDAIKSLFLDEPLARYLSQNYIPGRADLLSPLTRLKEGWIGWTYLEPTLELWKQDPEIQAFMQKKKISRLTQASLSQFLKSRPKLKAIAKPKPGCGPNFAKIAP